MKENATLNTGGFTVLFFSMDSRVVVFTLSFSLQTHQHERYKCHAHILF